MSDFDLDRYLRASGRVDLTGVDWDAIRDYPLEGLDLIVGARTEALTQTGGIHPRSEPAPPVRIRELV